MKINRLFALGAVALVVGACSTTIQVLPAVAPATAPSAQVPAVWPPITAPHGIALNGERIKLSNASDPETLVAFDLLVRPGTKVVVELVDAKGKDLGAATFRFVNELDFDAAYASIPDDGAWNVLMGLSGYFGTTPYPVRIVLDYTVGLEHLAGRAAYQWTCLSATIVASDRERDLVGPIALASDGEPAVWDGTAWDHINIDAGRRYPLVGATLLAVEPR